MNEKVTIKQAMKLVRKSDSTIRKLLKEGVLRGEKRREGKVTRVYIDRNHLLNVFAISHNFTDSKNERKNEVNLMSEKVITLLESQIAELKRENQKIEALNQELRETVKNKDQKIEALNSELKALLRDSRQRPRGIVGYLVERITRQ